MDKVRAYASRQFISSDGGPTGDATSAAATRPQVDRSAVTTFYRHVLEADAWQINDRKPTPGPNAADLCASKDGTYANLAFLLTDAYEITVADTAGAGARCT